MYFVTICTKDRRNILSRIIENGKYKKSIVEKTKIGEDVQSTLEYINNNKQDVSIEEFVIMPNHVHLLIKIWGTGGHGNKPLHRIIASVKSYVCKLQREKIEIWQRNYYEHIVRSEKELEEIWKYIDENPVKWKEDELYTE